MVSERERERWRGWRGRRKKSLRRKKSKLAPLSLTPFLTSFLLFFSHPLLQGILLLHGRPDGSQTKLRLLQRGLRFPRRTCVFFLFPYCFFFFFWSFDHEKRKKKRERKKISPTLLLFSPFSIHTQKRAQQQPSRSPPPTRRSTAPPMPTTSTSSSRRTGPATSSTTRTSPLCASRR